MPLEIIRNDIAKVCADIIVNTANPLVDVGNGVDSALYKAAGKDELFAERKKIGIMHPGEIALTPAFKLHAKYIIHTVGPLWEGGKNGEVETLTNCYKKALEKAKELKSESIAFPLIASGAYGFPKDVALKTAISEISSFLFNNEMIVYLVIYDKESFVISNKVFNDISSFIKEEEIIEPLCEKRNRSFGILKSNIHQPIKDNFVGSTFSKEPLLDNEFKFIKEASDQDIEDIIKNKQQTFQEYLFRLIDRKGLEDVNVYKKANIDRKHFSKIRSNANYNPSKRTALALAIALELNLDETKDLLLSAGIALSHSSVFDIIIEYCIEHHIYDIYEINCILFKYDQPTLGA